MKALVLSASLTLTLGIAGLVGCSAEHVTAVEDTAALVSEGEPVPGDPFGVVVAEASQTAEEVLVAEVDLARQEDVRRNWPFLRDRRIDAYAPITKRLLIG